MLVDRTHTRWMAGSLVVLVAATSLYLTARAASPGGIVHGGSPAGLLFGIIGSLFMVFAGMLAARRPIRTLRLGSAGFWMRGHLWLGSLSVPLLLFHAGFQVGGLLEQLLWLSFFAVVLSGVFGLILQQMLPALLGTTVQHETVSDPQFLADRLTLIADIHAADAWGPLALEESGFRTLIQRLNQVSDFKKLRELNGFDHRDVDLLIKVWTCTADLGSVKLPQEKTLPAYLASLYRDGASSSNAAGDDSASFGADEAKKSVQAGSPAAVESSGAVSPLDQIRGKSAQAGSPATGKSSGAVSPLDQIRGKSAEAGSPAAGKSSGAVSPLDQIRGKSAQAEAASPMLAVARKTAPAAKMPRGVAELVESEEAEVRVYLQDLYLRHIRPRLIATGSRRWSQGSGTGGEQVLLRMSGLSRSTKSRQAVEAIRGIYSERCEFDMQCRIRGLLQGWLLLHIPFTLILAVFFVVHVFVSLRVVPPFSQ